MRNANRRPLQPNRHSSPPEAELTAVDKINPTVEIGHNLAHVKFRPDGLWAEHTDRA
jgi:hypothetical protein